LPQGVFYRFKVVGVNIILLPGPLASFLKKLSEKSRTQRGEFSILSNAAAWRLWRASEFGKGRMLLVIARPGRFLKRLHRPNLLAYGYMGFRDRARVQKSFGVSTLFTSTRAL
jgi:hypothetical protein